MFRNLSEATPCSAASATHRLTLGDLAASLFCDAHRGFRKLEERNPFFREQASAVRQVNAISLSVEFDLPDPRQGLHPQSELKACLKRYEEFRDRFDHIIADLPGRDISESMTSASFGQALDELNRSLDDLARCLREFRLCQQALPAGAPAPDLGCPGENHDPSIA